MYMMRPVDGRVKAGKDRVFRERIASVGNFTGTCRDDMIYNV
jgi:hypothetical protein